MKKFILLFALLAAVSSYAGSLFPIIGNLPPGALLDIVRQPYYIGKAEQPVNKNYKVLGKVKGSGSIITVLCLFTFGDTSIEQLKKDAKKAYPDADDIINIEIDNDMLAVVCGAIFSKTELTLRGDAIKYIDSAKKR